MASVSISCPSCSATDGVVRNGKSTAGHQRYLCSHCRKTWQLQFTYTASQPGTHQKIIDMAMNGVGCRATARIMGVGLNTILRHLKLRPQSVTSRIQPGSDVIVCAEMDEQWGYVGAKSRQFARMLGLEPKNTAVRSPESNGIAESFVKTIKRDYISIMPKPDRLTAAKNLAEAFEHYNEWHPHSALGYRSPREYLRQQASNGLSDNRCLEI